MKKFLTCALCFVPNLVMARTLYYTPGGECPGLYLNPATTGCPGDSDRVVKLNVAKRADATFSGYKIGDVEIVDSAGNVKDNAVNTLVAARTAGTITDAAKISGYECVTGATKNKNDVCVNALSLNNITSENIAYIDWESLTPTFDNNGVMVDFAGGEIDPNEIKDNGTRLCGYDREFNIVIHWCPKNYKGINISYGGAHIEYDANPVDWGDLPCNQPDETYHYRWEGGTNMGEYTKDGYIKTEIEFPQATGWSPRGLYIVNYPEYSSNPSFNNIPYFSVLKTVADNLVTEKTTTWGTARLGLPFNQASVTNKIILNNTVGGFPDANANWQIWTCNGDIETVHMYAAWARNPIQNPGVADATLTIKRNGLSNNNNKGDVFYSATCDNGNTPTDANTYNPTCGTIKTINYTYKFLDSGGKVVAGCSAQGGSCSTGDTFNLAENVSCPDGYVFHKWETADGNDHDAGDPILCDTTTLGATDNASITGIVCDCNDTDAVSSRVCQSLCPTPDSGKGPGDLQPAFTIDENLTEETN